MSVLKLKQVQLVHASALILLLVIRMRCLVLGSDAIALLLLRYFDDPAYLGCRWSCCYTHYF